MNQECLERAERERAAAGERIAELEARVSSLLERLRALGAEKASLEGEKASLLRELAVHRTVLQRVTQSTAWRAASRYRHARDQLLAPGTVRRRLFDRVVGLVKGSPVVGASAPLPEAQYRAWLERNSVGPERISEVRAAAASLEFRPLVSVLTPVFEAEEAWLRRCVESVMSQAYDRWELCLVESASTKAGLGSVLAEYAARDSRIRTAKLGRGDGMVAAGAEALTMARGEFVALLDHEDELSLDALFEVVKAMQARRDLDLVYSDEDRLDERGLRVEPFFKPGWSPDLFLSMNYVGHLAVLRRALVEEVGGFRDGFDGSQDYDLLLRVTERTDRICRIPRVLYHERGVSQSARGVARPRALESGKRALEEALMRRGSRGAVSMTAPGRYRVTCALPDRPPRVSIIIPTRDRADLLRTCIGSIEERTSYPNYEILVIDNGSSERSAVRYLRKVGERHRVDSFDAPFNWSAINNYAARRAEGDLLLFMNNDMKVVNRDWLEAMVEHAIRPEVGAVGAKLLYPSGRIQHAGVVLGIGGVAGHAFKHLPENDVGYHALHQVIRNCSAVTGACMMVPRRVFEEAGGFDEDLRVSFNDIDFCLRLRAKGSLIVWTPFATLLHFESASRKALHPAEDEALMWGRWATVLADDPYYNPNLTLEYEDCRIGT